MLRAVFVRTLKAGVTYEQFKERLAEIVDTTELEGLYEDVFDDQDL